MTISMTIILVTLMFAGLVAILFFSKEKISGKETKIYKYMIILSICNLLTEFWLCLNILLNIPLYSMYNLFVNRLFLIFLYSWYLLFTYYTSSVSFQGNKNFTNNLKMKFGPNYSRKIFNIVGVIIAIVLLFIIILPIKLVNNNGYAYSTGLAVNFLLGVATVLYIIVVISILINKKTVSFKKIIPFIALTVCFAILILCRILNPGILLNSFSVAYPTILMFFTIENPDIKMIEELTRMQKASETINTDKSQFLYAITDAVQGAINGAKKVYENIMSYNPSPEIAEEAQKLKQIINLAEVKTRDTIDVSELDSKYLNPISNKYNFKLLISSIYMQLKDKVKEGVDFRFNISENIPDELYGDSVKLKQILTTVLTNSINFTNKGFIELRINSIIKYDVCRLIIAVEDSGKGMDIIKQTEISNSHDELTDTDINNLDNMDINLKVIKKMVSLIGGKFTLNSIENRGTTVEISIDQKVVVVEQTQEEKSLEKYAQQIENKRKIAIISENKDNTNILKKVIGRFDVLVDIYLVTKECLDKVREENNYDLIFIEENMDKINAETFLEKVKMIESFKTPVIVISDNKEFANKKRLVELGFDNVMTTPLKKEDIKSKMEWLINEQK